MQTVLDSAHTWFLESVSHQASGALVVHLIEGIKGEVRQFVEVGETRLGPYFPVKVEAQSRSVQVAFASALAFFVYNESYDTRDPELVAGPGRFLFKAETSSFRKFAEDRTTVAQSHQGQYHEFLLCCEDRVFQVLAAEEPEVLLLQEAPDLTLERTSTWSAS